ncbi:MAG: ssDNA-binding domain-containing protein [Acidobacteria bacterium]|nr:ssDNA-binding domain-containing protein [Acidobacteriota bacterium]
MTVYDLVTKQILEQLEKGVVPWQKPWNIEAPKNLSSGRPYRGINVILLGMRGFASPWWVTFRQAKERGGHVRKGERGSTVVFWKRDTHKVRNEETGEDETRQRFVLRYYTVFNVAQCEVIQAPAPRAPLAPIQAADAVVVGMPNPPRIRLGAAACYIPGLDTVEIPARDSFHSIEGYYSTLFHELTHSTGHESRLNRKGIMDVIRFGSEDYSKEELVAEMGAAMLCASVGIEATRDNSAAYIQTWLKNLRNDSRLVVMAAAQAQKAADYILDRANEEECAEAEQTQPEPAEATVAVALAA